MPFSPSIRYFHIWISFFVLSKAVFAFSPSPSSSPDTLRSVISCGPANEQSLDPTHNYNLIRAMTEIKEFIANDRLWAYSSSTDPSPGVFALLQCREDLSASDCRRCFAGSKSELRIKCHDSTSGRIHRDGCFLRFDEHDFSKEYLDARFDWVECTERVSGQAFYEDYAFQEFTVQVDEAFVNITLKAEQNGGFGAVVKRGRAVVVYALAQCWQTLDEDACRNCLVNARSNLRDCFKKEARAFLTGCYMRYSTHKFFDDAAEYKINDGTKEVPSGHEIRELALLVVSLSILTFFGTLIGYIRFSSKRKARKPSCSNFKYETLEKATEFFHDSRKLGQGGAGSVYEGNLPDGRTVAVKRLFFNTRQWTDQFFNEVNLISGIQHKNLVRLLGCSIEGPESLLVYEFVPNRSLDQILFVKTATHILSWKQRFGIIVGIAEGLEYLHGGCGVKIIHRDIKSNNILLDQNLTPKIADFGLARSIGHGKTHTNTGIAGTLGYMAPEYLIRGELTEKTDVYAFGVLILEVATGKKNSALTQGSHSVLYSVWKHYEANTLSHSIDSRLKGRFSEEEASKVLHIGLLCVQSSVVLRPIIPEIVSMLKNKECRCPDLEQAPFLNANFLLADEDTRVYDVINT